MIANLKDNMMAIGGIAVAFIVGLLFILLMNEKAEAKRWEAKYDNRVQYIATLEERYKNTADAARADAERRVRAQAVEFARINQENTDALEDQLVDARSRADAWRVRAQAAAASARSGRASQANAQADPASFVDGAGEGSVLAGTGVIPISEDDFDVCTVNTIKAQGWQQWWQSIERSWPTEK